MTPVVITSSLGLVVTLEQVAEVGPELSRDQLCGNARGALLVAASRTFAGIAWAAEGRNLGGTLPPRAMAQAREWIISASRAATTSGAFRCTL